MVNIEQVKQGFARYVDAEFTNKMTGINRWLVGGIAGIAILRAENIYNHLKDMPFIKMLDVVDENGMIDIDIIVLTGGTGAAWFPFFKEYFAELNTKVILAGEDEATFSNVKGYYNLLISRLV